MGFPDGLCGRRQRAQALEPVLRTIARVIGPAAGFYLAKDRWLTPAQYRQSWAPPPWTSSRAQTAI
jgi:hypothetical protein